MRRRFSLCPGLAYVCSYPGLSCKRSGYLSPTLVTQSLQNDGAPLLKSLAAALPHNSSHFRANA